jgi:UDP-N-acetylmuramoylalanyl-D-glutamyl-2,6-diaminopimelate--D-alanyl-D-alanyl ligase
MIYSTLQISQLTDSKLIGNPDILISNISFDSRNLYSISDTAFIAINTKNNSGEKYISSVVEKGVKSLFLKTTILNTKTLHGLSPKIPSSFYKF